MKRPALLAIGIALLSGCAVFEDEYGCKGFPDGARCQSVQSIYSQTNDRDALLVIGGADDNAALQPAPQGQWTHDPSFPVTPDPTVTPDYSLPVRSAAGVMRIWVAPWEDSEGDLNMSAYIFTELEKRKWLIGEPTVDTRSVLYPLDIVQPKDGGKPPARR